MFTRSCTLRGRPTDAPLKKAPFSKYLWSNTFSTYTWGRRTLFPTTRVYPALAPTTKLGLTLIDRLKAKSPVP